MNRLLVFAAVFCLSVVVAQPVTTIVQVRPLFLETPLVRDGAPAVIAAQGELKTLGERLAAAIQAKFDVTLEVRDDVTWEALKDRDVIALGNVNDNAVIKRLYGMRLTYLDAVYPGGPEASGGFDLPLAGIAPRGWQFSCPTGPTHTIAVDTAVAHSQPQSIRIDGVKPGEGRACVMRNLPVLSPGKSYVMRVWYRGQVDADANGTLHVDFYRGDERLDIRTVKLIPTDAWQEATLAFTVPAGAELSRCLLYLFNQGSLWYDDASLEDDQGRDLLAGSPGYVVHTVHNPFGTGHNAIVAGGSDAAGHKLAVDELIATLNGLAQPVLPRQLDVHPGDTAVSQGLVSTGPDEASRERRLEAVRRTLATNAYVPVRDTFQSTRSWAVNYQLSGDRRHAGMYQGIWRALLDSDASWTHRDMEWIFYAIEGWDLIEEDPIFTDAERLEITQRLLDIGCANEAAFGQRVQNVDRLIADGHQLDQDLCLFIHGLYFDRYYHINGHWMTIAQPLLDLAAQAPRVHDSYAYGPIIGDDFMSQYAFKTGDTAYFDTGSFRQLADWVMLCSDNLGAGGTFGDDGAWRGTVRTPLLAKAFGTYGDPRFLWFGRDSRPPLGCFATQQPARPPNDLLGVAWIPLHDRLYRTAIGQPADAHVKQTWDPESVPPSQAFDKLSFRSGFKPEDQYLLVDGLSSIPHGHRDGASILRFTDNGRLWLTEGHYIEIAPERHNTLVVNRDGASWDPPPLVALQNATSLPQAGLVRLLTSNYNGVDWSRSIQWVPERFFLVTDTVTARDAGDYTLTLNWQTLGDVTLTNGALTVVQENDGFTIADLDGAQCTLTEELHRLGGNYYASYPGTRDGLVKHLHQVRRATLQPGQTVRFINLLHTHPGAEATLHGELVSDGAVRVSGPEGSWIAGVGPGKSPLGGIDADLWMVGSSGLAAAGLRTIDSDMASVTATAQLNVGLDLTTGLVSFDAPVETELTVRLPDGTEQTMPVHAGKTTFPTPLVQDATPWINQLTAQPPAAQEPPAEPTESGLSEAATVELPHAPHDWCRETGCSITSTVAPLPESTWTSDYKIRLDSLLGRSDSIVLWSAGETPTVTVDLGAERPLTAVRLNTMWTDNSARGLAYRFDHATVSAATAPDGPWLPLGELRETEDHPVPSTPVYELDGLDLSARVVRFELAPKADAGLFLQGVALLGPATDQAPPDGIVPWGTSGGTALLAADLDGDGTSEVLVGTATGQVLACTAAGGRLWTAELSGAATALAAGDLDGDGKPEVLAGTDAQALLCLGPDGGERWRHEFDVFWGRRGDVRTITVADLDGDGRNEVVCGTESWHYWCLEPDGKVRWQHEILHGATEATVADLDGDGKAEVIAGHEYYSPRVLGFDGQLKFGVGGSGPWCLHTAAGDLDGDGRPEALLALEDDTVHARNAKGEAVFDTNVGGFASGLACADLDGDGKAEVVVGVQSATRNVVALAADGGERWHADLPSPVASLALLPGNRVAAGCDDGWLAILGSDGAVQAARRFPLPVTALVAVGERLALLSGGRLILLARD